MNSPWRDVRVRVWSVAVACVVVVFGAGSGPPVPLTWLAWLLLTAVHVGFVVEAWPLVRARSTPGHARRIWGALLAGVLIFLVADGVQLLVMPRQPWTPAMAIGVPAQQGLMLLGVAVIILVTTVEPLRLGTGSARLRFWLDIGVVLASVAAVAVYVMPPDRVGDPDLVAVLATGPGLFCVGVFAVLKLTLMPERPFTRVAGRILAAGALVESTLANSIVLTSPRTVQWCQGAAVIASALLTMSARIQRIGRDDAVQERPRRSRRYSVLPYVAAVAANALLVHSLHANGLNRTAWLVVGATVLANLLVIARQLLALAETSRLLDTLDARVAELHDALGQRDELASELRHLAFHDPLTGLANRAMFTHLLAETLAAHRRNAQGPPPAVVLLDLDGFKLVNDRHGHEAGDGLLVAVAHRLQTCTRPGDLLARLGGDEFVVLLEASREEACAVADRAVQAIAQPFDLGSATVTVGASAGVALSDPDEDDPDGDAVLRRADAAMYRAKQAGKGQSALQAATGA